ncbi:MAG: cytochrome c [Verrucomicrobiota bacterium]
MKHIVFAGIVAVSLIGAASTQAEDGKALYDKDCAKCHGADGAGKTKMGAKLGIKDYTDAKVQAELKDDKAMKIIKEGLKEGEKTLMKPAEGLTDDQIKSLIAYMRTLKK